MKTVPVQNLVMIKGIPFPEGERFRQIIVTLRPREVHFGIPFRGFPESLAVFDEAWLKSPRPIDFERVHIPPEDTGVLGSNWRTRFVFDFLLPDPELIFHNRIERVDEGSFPVDEKITLEQAYLVGPCAEHDVMIRDFIDVQPQVILFVLWIMRNNERHRVVQAQ